MTRSPSYLSQNQYGYCFRVHIPQDLQNHFAGKKELKRRCGWVLLCRLHFISQNLTDRTKRKWFAEQVIY